VFTHLWVNVCDESSVVFLHDMRSSKRIDWEKRTDDIYLKDLGRRFTFLLTV
jgi:hypothetical protein